MALCGGDVGACGVEGASQLVHDGSAHLGRRGVAQQHGRLRRQLCRGLRFKECVRAHAFRLVLRARLVERTRQGLSGRLEFGDPCPFAFERLGQRLLGGLQRGRGGARLGGACVGVGRRLTERRGDIAALCGRGGE